MLLSKNNKGKLKMNKVEINELRINIRKTIVEKINQIIKINIQKNQYSLNAFSDFHIDLIEIHRIIVLLEEEFQIDYPDDKIPEDTNMELKELISIINNTILKIKIHELKNNNSVV